MRLPDNFPCPLGFLLAKTHVGLRAIVDAELAPYGLTVVQFSLLNILAAEPGKSSAELARAGCVSPQSVAPQVSRLEADGYLERRSHPLHRRVIECRITAKGAEVLERVRPVVARLESEWILAELSPEELKVLEELLYRLLNRLRSTATTADNRLC
ncbi:MAG: MarR family winged helix-turn-helix transcriptional regulator [Acidimicrobiales bacterium]